MISNVMQFVAVVLSWGILYALKERQYPKSDNKSFGVDNDTSMSFLYENDEQGIVPIKSVHFSPKSEKSRESLEETPNPTVSKTINQKNQEYRQGLGKLINSICQEQKTSEYYKCSDGTWNHDWSIVSDNSMKNHFDCSKCDMPCALNYYNKQMISTLALQNCPNCNVALN